MEKLSIKSMGGCEWVIILDKETFSKKCPYIMTSSTIYMAKTNDEDLVRKYILGSKSAEKTLKRIAKKQYFVTWREVYARMVFDTKMRVYKWNFINKLIYKIYR